MSFIGSQVRNSILAQLKELKNEELKKFAETWEVVNYTESPTQWHMGWKCIPLGLTFTLLQAPETEGAMKNSLATQSFSFFNDQLFIEVAHKQGKKIMEYNDELMKQFISHLPTQDDAGKGMFLTQMMCGSSLGEVHYPGYYSGHYQEWKGVGEYISMFMTTPESDDCKNTCVLSGGSEKSFWAKPEEFPFHYFTTNCNHTDFMIGMVYEIGV